MHFAAPIPILRIFDEAKARAFYVDWLGFKVDWEHRFEPERRARSNRHDERGDREAGPCRLG
jgi:catechol 2,3-dioxygenase-like lactoylglutathione lyase family enzyme